LREQELKKIVIESNVRFGVWPKTITEMLI